MQMLKIEDMHVYYGAIHAVKGVSFEVGEGEIVALIGANGAGKSTILKTVSGLMHPRSGSIHFCDQDITHAEAFKLLRTGLAHVPEGRRIFQQMTVQENLEMGAYINKEVSAQDLEMVFNYFPRLKERRKQIAGTLSGGEQQMLAMSRALMSHPKLMMLDEPSMGLAPIRGAECPEGFADCRPCLCSGNRQHHPQRYRRGACQLGCREESLLGRLIAFPFHTQQFHTPCIG